MEPSSEAERLLVGGGESGRFYLIDGRTERILLTSSAMPQQQDAFALSPDGTVLYFTAFDIGKPTELLALDTRSLRTLWRELLPDIAARTTIGDVRIHGTYTLAVSSDGDKVLLDGERGDTLGFVAVDLQSRTPVRFIGPMVSNAGVTAMVSPDSDGSSGTLLIGGARYLNHEHKNGYVFSLNDSTWEIRDSIKVTQTTDDRGGIRQIVPSPDRRYIYILALDSLFKFDTVERQITAREGRPVPWPRAQLAIAPDGNELYMTDPGDGRDSPGTGMLHVIGADFDHHETVDLRGADGTPRVGRSVAVSSDGSLVYVVVGTASRGPLFGPQVSRILTVDRRTTRVVGDVPLGDWGVSAAFVY